MDKKTIVLIVLAVVAVAVVIKQLGVFSSSKPKPPPAAIASKAEATKAPQASDAALLAKKLQSMPADGYTALVATLEESDIAFDRAGFKNPMTPAKGKSGRPQNWRPIGPVVVEPIAPPKAEMLSKKDSIEGIVWNDKDPLALVNNRVVGIGEKLEDGAVVTDITRDTVRFNRNGQRYYLVLREE